MRGGVLGGEGFVDDVPGRAQQARLGSGCENLLYVSRRPAESLAPLSDDWRERHRIATSPSPLTP